MPEDRHSLLPERREKQIWVGLRRTGAVVIAAGATLAVAGILERQSLGLVALDVLIIVIGVILLFVVRLRP